MTPIDHAPHWSSIVASADKLVGISIVDIGCKCVGRISVPRIAFVAQETDARRGGDSKDLIVCSKEEDLGIFVKG
jgi:hypothetical protein